MDKTKCYTMKSGGSTLIAFSIDDLLETLRSEFDEGNITEEDSIEFEFGIKYLTEEEIKEIPEDFSGF